MIKDGQTKRFQSGTGMDEKANAVDVSSEAKHDLC